MVIATPLIAEPFASVDPASNPSSMIMQTSAGPNWKATRVSTGAKNTILFAVIGLVVSFAAYAIVNWVLDIF